MSDFSADTEGGVCTISWDTPGKSMNVMSLEALAELDALVSAALEDARVKGIVITSAKPGSFAGGMDLKTLAAMREAAGDDPAKGIFEGIMALHAALRRIERAGMDAANEGGKPIACALPGTALGYSALAVPPQCQGHLFSLDHDRQLILKVDDDGHSPP